MAQKLQGSYVRHSIRLLTVTMLCIAVGLALMPSARAEVVVRYAFNGDVNDSMGNANGTTFGSVLLTGGSVVLPGGTFTSGVVPNYVEFGLGMGTVMSQLGDCSFEFWAQVGGTTTVDKTRYFDFGTSVTTWLHVCALESGRLNMGTCSTNGGSSWGRGGGINQAMSELVLPLQHVGTGVTGKMYVNGAFVAQNTLMTVAMLPSSMGVTTQNWLGRSQYTTQALLNATFLDFRVYNNALTATDVANHYTSDLATLGADGMYVWNSTGAADFNTPSNWDMNAQVVNPYQVPNDTNKAMA